MENFIGFIEEIGFIGSGGSGPTPPVASLRQAASRAYMSNVINSGLPTSMNRVAHYTTRAATQLRLTWVNGYLDGGEGQFTPSGATMTITASVEYPAGTFSQVKFGGSATGTAASGLDLVSDLTNVSIPAGTQFWVRTWYSNPNGAMYQAKTGDYIGFGEAFNYGGTVSDLTMSGSVPNQGQATAYSPIRIESVVSDNAYLCIGDSRFAGTGDAYNLQSPEVGEIARSLWGNRAYSVLGGPGARARDFVANSALQVRIAGSYTAIVCGYGINDLQDGVTAAVLQTRIDGIKALFPGKAFYQTTLAPVTTSSDSWATLAGQTVLGLEAQRVIYNNAVRAGIAGNAGYVEIADQLESSRNSGKWKVTGAANYATNDGLHANQTGYSLIPASGAVLAALPA